MSLLNKKLLRDIRAHKAQVISVLLIVFLGTLIFTTLLLVPRSLGNKLTTIFDRTSYESFRLQVAGAPKVAVERLGAVGGVASVQGTVEKDVSAIIKGSDLTLRVISVPDVGEAKVNGLLMESGSYPAAGSGDVIVERHLANEFGIEPGGTVTLLVNGRQVPVKVSGSAASPRFLRLVADQSTFLSDPAQFGVLFMRESDVARLLGASEYSAFAARVTDPAQEEAVMKAAAVAMQQYGVLGANTGAEEQSTRLINMDVTNMRSVSLFFVLVFLWVSSLAIYITIARIIYTQQRQIGTARALGYSEKSIVGHFLSYGLVLGVLGGLLGAAGGLLAAGLVVRSYSNTLGLPTVQTPTSVWDLLLAGLGIAVLLSVLGAVVPALRSAKILPAAAMRVDAGVSLREPSAKSVKRSEQRKRLPSWLRFPMRNLSRNRRRTALTVVGLVFTVATLVTVSGAIGSIDFMLHKQFDQITTWNVAAFLSVPAGQAMLEDVRGIEVVDRAEPAISSPARLEAEGATTDVLLQAYPEDTAMHGLVHAEGKGEPPRDGGMLVNRSVRRQVPLEVGDKVKITTALGSAVFRVDGFVKEPLGVGCYVDLAYVQKLIGRDVFNVVVIQCNPRDEALLAATLRKMDGVSKVETRSSTLGIMDSAISRAIRPMFNVVLVMVLVIGFAIVFTFTSITMLERRQEIATVLTLGSGPLSVTRSFLVETVSIGLIVLPFGVLAGWGLCWVLMNKVFSTSTTQLAPEMHLSIWPVIGLAALFLAVMALSVLPASRHLSKIDLATAARERAG